MHGAIACTLLYTNTACRLRVSSPSLLRRIPLQAVVKKHVERQLQALSLELSGQPCSPRSAGMAGPYSPSLTGEGPAAAPWGAADEDGAEGIPREHEHEYAEEEDHGDFGFGPGGTAPSLDPVMQAWVQQHHAAGDFSFTGWLVVGAGARQ